jgi:hypothetical protein
MKPHHAAGMLFSHESRKHLKNAGFPSQQTSFVQGHEKNTHANCIDEKTLQDHMHRRCVFPNSFPSIHSS